MRWKKAIYRNKKFGQLTVVGPAHSPDHHTRWTCICDCGKTCAVRVDYVLAGKTKTCGFGHRYSEKYHELPLEDFPEYKIWLGIKQRCYNPKAPAYKYYGALHVRMCKAWRDDFWTFLSDMRCRPSEQHSVDRYPDPFGDYEPGNCRWATATEQARNKRNTVFVEADGKRMSLTDYCEAIDLSSELVRLRMHKGWSIEEAVSVRPRPSRKIAP